MIGENGDRSTPKGPLKVGINAQLASGTVGGVEQALIGLAGSLSALTDSDEEYYFLTLPGQSGWLEPYMGGNCRIVECKHTPVSTGKTSRLRSTLSAVAPWFYNQLRKLPPTPWTRVVLPSSDETLEELGVDLIHFPHQAAFTTTVPSIYQPWDLQHIHLPHFFTPRERKHRSTVYRSFSDRAAVVVVASNFTRNDLEERLGIASSKTAVIPMAPPNDLYPVPTEADIRDIRSKFNLPERFLFFPAQTFKHKNHRGLIDALALLKETKGSTVSVVCSGRKNEFYPVLEQAMKDRRVQDQVHFVGHVMTLELQSLYRLADGLIFPTLFEGWGLPITEAFLAGIPVASSNVTCLPEQAADAALFFDPTSVSDMAAAIHRLWTDESLRSELVARGSQRVQQQTWHDVASNFRALYRMIGQRHLSPDDSHRLTKMMTIQGVAGEALDG